MKPRLIAWVKSVLPDTIYTPARSYVVRLLTWKRLMSHIRGVSARDHFWLQLSFLVSPFTAARALREWRDPLLLSAISVDVSGVGRFMLRARTDDLWHVTPFREPSVLACIRSRLRPGDRFVDAGANIGFYSIVAASKVGEDGQVLAVEMMRETADILRDHIAINDAQPVRVVQGALSAREGETITAFMPSGSYGQASISNPGQGERFEVASTTLNAILRDVPSIRLMKMDIEGAELAALKGSGDVLDRVEAIIFEHAHAREASEVNEFLVAHGFQITPLDSCNSIAVRIQI